MIVNSQNVGTASTKTYPGLSVIKSVAD